MTEPQILLIIKLRLPLRSWASPSLHTRGHLTSEIRIHLSVRLYNYIITEIEHMFKLNKIKKSSIEKSTRMPIVVKYSFLINHL